LFPEQIYAIEEFIDELSKDIVVFDPLGILDIGWQTVAIAQEKLGEQEIDISFKVDDKKKKVRISVNAIHEIRDYLVFLFNEVDFSSCYFIWFQCYVI
jgi:hypothetical protein